jgi:uncharacterized protein UPF0158
MALLTPCNRVTGKLRFPLMRKIPIHWDDLESAFERNSPDTESFLDIAHGNVISITVGDPEAPSLKAKVASNISNFIRVDPASSREQYRWMERFVGSVTDPQLRERLVMAIDGKGAFRRFKDVLLAYPAERERWFTYRADLLHWHIHNWLLEREVEPTTSAPWGEAKPPPDLGDAPPVPIPHGTEAPGEALRRQARELIDSLAAIELPSAIAFLEFLSARGSQAMTSSGAPPARLAPAPVAEPDLEDELEPNLKDDDDEEEEEEPKSRGRRAARGAALAAKSS